MAEDGRLVFHGNQPSGTARIRKRSAATFSSPAQAGPPAHDPFIVTTSAAKPDEASRKFIRSHVMRGKNRRKRNQVVRHTLPGSWINDMERPVEQAASPPGQLEDLQLALASVTSRGISLPLSIPPRVGAEFSLLRFADEMKPHRVELVVKCMHHPPIHAMQLCSPSTTSAEFPCTQTWACTWDATVSQVLGDTYANKENSGFTAIKRSLYPIEVCVDSDMVRPWFEYLASNKAYLHSVFFVAQAVLDYLRLSEFGPATVHYLTNTLNFLQQNLNNPGNGTGPSDIATSDSTIAAVQCLVLMADAVGDIDSAEKHMRGMFQLVALRGGIRALAYNPQVQFKVLRTDLGFAINNDKKPLFFSEGISWDTYIADSDSKSLEDRPALSSAAASSRASDSGSASEQQQFRSDSPPATIPHRVYPTDDIPDWRLVNIWLDLREFSRAANLAFQTGRKLSAELFQEVVISAQYRLLQLPGFSNDHVESSEEGNAPTRSIQETVFHLGMLAFSATTFLSLEGMPMRYNGLGAKVRRSVVKLSEIDKETVDTKDWKGFLHMKLWYLFVANISVMNGPDDEQLLVAQLAETLVKLGLKPQRVVSGSSAGSSPASTTSTTSIHGPTARLGQWNDVREVLINHLWIDCVHGARGRVLFNKAIEL